MKYTIVKTLLITLAAEALSQTAFAQNYENTQEEKIAFSDFVQKQKGTLICKAVDDYIYGKGITTYVAFNKVRQKYLLSAYDNNSGTWLTQKLEVTLRAAYENIAYFNSVDPYYSFEIGAGEFRDFISMIADTQTSAEFPYTGGFRIQFHNICKIDNH